MSIYSYPQPLEYPMNFLAMTDDGIDPETDSESAVNPTDPVPIDLMNKYHHWVILTLIALPFSVWLGIYSIRSAQSKHPRTPDPTYTLHAGVAFLVGSALAVIALIGYGLWERRKRKHL